MARLRSYRRVIWRPDGVAADQLWDLAWTADLV